MKAPRNKTIDLDLEEGAAYLARCVKLSGPAELSAVLDRTILGDSFAVLPLLPRGFADLLIVDPPTTSPRTSTAAALPARMMKLTRLTPAAGWIWRCPY